MSKKGQVDEDGILLPREGMSSELHALLSDPEKRARMAENIKKLQGDRRKMLQDMDLDGTQKWPFEGGNIWLGDPSANPYDDGDDIRVGSASDND